MNYELYLASASPRRRELLDMLGFSYRLLLPNADENCTETDPGRYVAALAARKAEAAMELLIAEERKNALILGADTVVYANGEILGKPKDRADATRMLESFEGTTHHVYSGIALATASGTVSASECTTVHFGAMSKAEIDAYVSTGEPMDKAGSYAVQGVCSMWIDGIEGCHFNVIGLPIRRLYKTLCEMGIDPLSLRRKPENG